MYFCRDGEESKLDKEINLECQKRQYFVKSDRRHIQIRVRVESRVKKKFLAALNQLQTSFFQCHDLPWSHSFLKRYDMYIVKMNGSEN